MLVPKGCGPSHSIMARIALATLRQLAAPAQCTGHPSALRFSSLHTGPEYRRGLPSLGVQTAAESRLRCLAAFRSDSPSALSDERSLRDLACEALASRSLSVLGPLGRSAEQRRPAGMKQPAV
jgi:hypothetical protein